MVIHGDYMFEFSVSKYIIIKYIIRQVTVEKVVAHLCLTIIANELKISIEHGNNTKYNQTLNILFSVVCFSIVV